MESEGDEALKRSNRTKHSEDSMLTNPSLPQELIREILVRLPVQYLLQFKCVSKEWFGLISSPEFAKTHLTFSVMDHTRHRFLLDFGQHFKYCSVSSLFDNSVIETFDLDNPMDDTCIDESGSVNGLICLLTRSDALVLWNPSIRKFKQVLPDSMPTQPYDAMHSFGFGYDEVCDDYKVVVFFCTVGNVHLHAEIYSLKSDSWRSLDDFPEWPLPCSAEFVNGKLHWVTCNGANDYGIISIDLVNEKYRKVEQPNYGEGDFKMVELGVLGSDLCVLSRVFFDERSEADHSDLWVMKEYGVKESWTKLYSVRCPTYNNSPPLCMSSEGEFFIMLDGTLVIYNAEDGSTRYPRVTNVDHSHNAKLYVESLVCPMSQNEPRDTEGCIYSGCC